MNARLVKYGISEEESDIRAHVTLIGRQIVVFPTAEIVRLIGETQYREATATQPGVNGQITARGYVVPITDIQRLAIVRSDKYPWPTQKQYDDMSLSNKGDIAVQAVCAAIRANRFPLWVSADIVSDIELDIRGMDITINARRRIQVKHDWGCWNGGTGNVFIQTHECNPLKQYGALYQPELF